MKDQQVKLIFEYLDEFKLNFNGLNGRFDGVEKRLSSIENHLSSHDQKLENHDQRFDSHDERFDRLEGRLNVFQVYVEEKFEIYDAHFIHIEGGMNAIQTSVDNLAKQVKDFRDEIVFNNGRVTHLENWTKKAASVIDLPLIQ